MSGFMTADDILAASRRPSTGQMRRDLSGGPLFFFEHVPDRLDQDVAGGRRSHVPVAVAERSNQHANR